MYAWPADKLKEMVGSALIYLLEKYLNRCRNGGGDNFVKIKTSYRKWGEEDFAILFDVFQISYENYTYIINPNQYTSLRQSNDYFYMSMRNAILYVLRYE